MNNFGGAVGSNKGSYSVDGNANSTIANLLPLAAAAADDDDTVTVKRRRPNVAGNSVMSDRCYFVPISSSLPLLSPWLRLTSSHLHNTNHQGGGTEEEDDTDTDNAEVQRSTMNLVAIHRPIARRSAHQRSSLPMATSLLRSSSSWENSSMPMMPISSSTGSSPPNSPKSPNEEVLRTATMIENGLKRQRLSHSSPVPKIKLSRRTTTSTTTASSIRDFNNNDSPSTHKRQRVEEDNEVGRQRHRPGQRTKPFYNNVDSWNTFMDQSHHQRDNSYYEDSDVTTTTTKRSIHSSSSSPSYVGIHRSKSLDGQTTSTVPHHGDNDKIRSTSSLLPSQIMLPTL